MTKIGFRKENLPITEKMILEYECFIGFRLPEDYRDYLSQHNGEQPYIIGRENDPLIFPTVWTTQENKKKIVAKCLGPMGLLLEHLYRKYAGKELRDLRYLYQENLDRIPHDLIPIACHPGGSLIVMGKGAQPGEILFWDVNLCQWDENDNPTYDNIGFIANNFTEFLQRLEPEPDNWEAWEIQHQQG